MKTSIYYFTGTGNSLLVARKIAARLDDATVRPISELRATPDACSDSDAVGFIFPIYFDRMPDPVRLAIAECTVATGAHLFAVTTSGEKTGNALYAVDKLLRRRGMALGYGVNLALADNSIVAKTSPAEADSRFARLDAVADEIAEAVRGRETNDIASQRSTALAAFGHVSSLGLKRFYGAERRIVDGARCTQCGLCAKLCPADNISTTADGVTIGRDCQWCFACLNWCPQQAIRFGRVDPAVRGQYRCPGVSASDIWRAQG